MISYLRPADELLAEMATYEDTLSPTERECRAVIIHLNALLAGVAYFNVLMTNRPPLDRPAAAYLWRYACLLYTSPSPRD